jgi:Fe-S-cluster containining protein
VSAKKQFKECESCPGYCCIGSKETPAVPLTNDDINRIAEYFKMPIDKFVNDFVALSHGRIRYGGASIDAIGHIKFAGACMFLRQGLCGIQDVKPYACRAQKPNSFGDVTCRMWHKMRLGYK